MSTSYMYVYDDDELRFGGRDVCGYVYSWNSIISWCFLKRRNGITYPCVIYVSFWLINRLPSLLHQFFFSRVASRRVHCILPLPFMPWKNRRCTFASLGLLFPPIVFSVIVDFNLFVFQRSEGAMYINYTSQWYYQRSVDQLWYFIVVWKTYRHNIRRVGNKVKLDCKRRATDLLLRPFD